MQHNISSWFKHAAKNNDIVVSTRIRALRNLRGYALPASITRTNGIKLRNKIFSALDKAPFAKDFTVIALEDLDATVQKQLEENALLAEQAKKHFMQGCAIHHDGAKFLSINVKDHLRIVSIGQGFDLNALYAPLYNYTHYFDKEIPVLCAENYGFLAANLDNTGTGLQFSTLISLPALFFQGKLDKQIEALARAGLVVKGYYTPKADSSIGWLYLISTQSGGYASSQAQSESFGLHIHSLINEERRAYESLQKKELVLIENHTIRAFVLGKYAKLMSLPESMNIILKLKLALNAQLLSGIEHHQLNRLLFQVQTGNLALNEVQKDCNIKEIEQNIEQIRAKTIQGILENAQMGSL